MSSLLQRAQQPKSESSSDDEPPPAVMAAKVFFDAAEAAQAEKAAQVAKKKLPKAAELAEPLKNLPEPSHLPTAFAPVVAKTAKTAKMAKVAKKAPDAKAHAITMTQRKQKAERTGTDEPPAKRQKATASATTVEIVGATQWVAAPPPAVPIKGDGVCKDAPWRRSEDASGATAVSPGVADKGRGHTGGEPPLRLQELPKAAEDARAAGRSGTLPTSAPRPVPYVATQHPTHMHGNLPNSGVSGEQGENYSNCRQGSGVWRAGSQRYGGRGGRHAEWETTRRWAQSRGRLQEFLQQYPKAGCPYPKGSIIFG